MFTVVVEAVESRAHEAPRWDNVRVRASFALVVLGFAASVTLVSAVERILAGGDEWLAGDWLINYSGGFVRRGFFGQLLLSFGPDGAGALVVLLAIQVLCYAILGVYVIWFLIGERFSWSGIALTCGPAALGFIGWDPQGAFRKEIIAFVVLVLLAVARSSREARLQATLGLVAAAIYVVAVLSWEGSGFLLPVILYLLLGETDAPGPAWRMRGLAVAFSGTAVVGVSLAISNAGTPATAARICESVRANGLTGEDLCDGAIDAVGWTLGRNVNDVIAALPNYVGYIPAILLAALPIVASRWFTRNWRWALVIAAAILPLYAIAIDWGRWTHILAVSLAVSIMASRPGDAQSRIWSPVSTILYVSLWGMAHVRLGWHKGFIETLVQAVEMVIQRLAG